MLEYKLSECGYFYAMNMANCILGLVKKMSNAILK